MYRIFDTSVWIGYFNGVKDHRTDFLDYCLENDQVCMIGVIAQEVLQGVKIDSKYYSIKSHFKNLPSLPAPTFELYDGSAQLYRLLRKRGITIRKANDYLIAHYCIHFDMELCHADFDFDQIAENTSLKIWKPS